MLVVGGGRGTGELARAGLTPPGRIHLSTHGPALHSGGFDAAQTPPSTIHYIFHLITNFDISTAGCSWMPSSSPLPPPGISMP
ncbi:hypothetical protein ACH58_25570 [Achromobacter xylosoxidans]|nr:hypothetical protein ACH58_25570 [Achromobacter xylosoxidans]